MLSEQLYVVQDVTKKVDVTGSIFPVWMSTHNIFTLLKSTLHWGKSEADTLPITLCYSKLLYCTVNLKKTGMLTYWVNLIDVPVQNPPL